MGTRIVGILLTFAAAAWAQQQSVTIQGKVVDSEGNGVQDVDVSSLWDDGKPVGGVKTDAEGRFSLEVPFHGRPIAVMALDKERKRGRATRFSPGSFDKVRELELETVVRVHGKFSCKELGERPSWTNVYVMYLPGGIRFAQQSSDKAEFDLRLPPGDYSFHMYGTDVKDVTVDRFIEGDEGEIDLGTIDLEATAIAKLYGKRCPELKISDARGVKPDFKLADLRGKYVLIEFWGSW